MERSPGKEARLPAPPPTCSPPRTRPCGLETKAPRSSRSPLAGVSEVTLQSGHVPSSAALVQSCLPSSPASEEAQELLNRSSCCGAVVNESD